MPDRHLLEQAIEAVADRQPVDWDLLDSQASSDLREELACLRILGALDQLHAPGDEDAAESGATEGGAGDASGARRPSDSVDAIESFDTADLRGSDRDSDGGGRDEAEDDTSSVELGLWGRFRLLAKVGQGSFGRVYRAWDPQLEREVALKILHGASMSDRLKEQVLREGRALARIRDNNVVAVHGVEWYEGRAALCMEFVRGRTLDDVVFSDGRLPVHDVVRIGGDVCRALSAVHRSGVVHRDVKARNVMRDESGRIVLMDFGAGQDARLSDTTRKSDAAGTPLYMAPELFDGGDASPRSDVYSVAVLLFYLLTGEYPRRAQTISELRAAHRAPLPSLRQSRTDVPTTLARVVEKGLAANPKDRYPHAAALLEALDAQQPRQALARPAHQRVGRVFTIGSAGVAMAIALGTLTSVVFDHTLGRVGFTGESWGDWVLWGVRASVAPAAVFVLAWLLSVCLRLLRVLLITVSARAVAIDEAIRRTCGRWIARWGLDDPSILAASLVLLGAAGLAALWWYFWPLIDAFATSIATDRREILAPLSPAFAWYQERYRKAFSVLLLANVMGWYVVRRVAARHQQVMRSELVAGAVAVLALVMMSLDVPYRLFLHNRFDMVQWSGQTCYVLGAREPETLLFCPCLSKPPLHRTVATTTPELQRLGRKENIYTSFVSACPKP
jgi:hypothetical protein